MRDLIRLYVSNEECWNDERGNEQCCDYCIRYCLKKHITVNIDTYIYKYINILKYHEHIMYRINIFNSPCK